MSDPIKRALTRRKKQRGPPIDEEPNEKVVLGVKFGIAMTVCLSAIEIAHMAIIHTWNAEIFTAILSLSCTVFGIFVGQKT